jgi:ATP-dependent helicase/nuclease subunit A
VIRVDERGRIERLVIDRTFVDARTGERWLVDYKTGQPQAGESGAQFLARECSAHRGQLVRYRDAHSGLVGETVRVALYFTAIGHLQRMPELDLERGSG